MFGWDEAAESHDQVYGRNGQANTANLSHEVIAGAAAFEGFKAYEDHQRTEGNQVSHAFGKQLLAGLAGAEADRLAETKGMDEFQRLETRHKAKEGAKNMYEQHYEQGLGSDDYDPNRDQAPEHLRKKFHGRDWA